jgi:hypothetical protein
MVPGQSLMRDQEWDRVGNQVIRQEIEDRRQANQLLAACIFLSHIYSWPANLA